MNILRLGLFNEETGEKIIKKVDVGFYNPTTSLADNLSTRSVYRTTIDNIEYGTILVNFIDTADNVKHTFTGGSTIDDLFQSESGKIFVMKNEKERTKNFLQVRKTATEYTNMQYFVGTSPISQESTLSLPNSTGVVKMAYYYRIINNIMKEFAGWMYTAPTGQTNNAGEPIYRISGVLIDFNFWEKGKVAPFGDPTPSGSIGGYGTYDDTSDNFPIPPNRLNDVYSSILSNTTGKIQMYTLDSAAYSAFLGKIYTNDFWQYWQNTIFNPLDGIYSCTRVPFNELALTRSAVAKINVSNTELEILAGAYRVTGGFVQDETIVSGYDIKEYFGSYLDYAPHTTCELYIPFYGIVNIDINEIMGGNISITRRNNYVNGDFVVFVQCTNRFSVTVTHAYAGNAAMTLPITAGNNGGPNRIIDLVQGVANVALGNYVGGAINAVNAITEKGYTSTIQKLSGGAGWCSSHDFALIIHRLCQSNPEKYSEIKQRPADMFVKLSDLSGEYSIEKQNLDINDKNITDDEITEIENILQGGAIF